RRYEHLPACELGRVRRPDDAGEAFVTSRARGPAFEPFSGNVFGRDHGREAGPHQWERWGLVRLAVELPPAGDGLERRTVAFEQRSGFVDADVLDVVFGLEVPGHNHATTEVDVCPAQQPPQLQTR